MTTQRNNTKTTQRKPAPMRPARVQPQPREKQGRKRSAAAVRALAQSATLDPLEPLTALQPERFETELHAQFDVDVRPLDWQKARMSANDRPHHLTKSNRNALWRQLTESSALQQSIEPLSWARLVVYVRFPTNARREVSNLQPTAKAIVDGIVDAKLLPDDRDECADGPDVRRLWPNGPHRVIVQMWRKV